MNAARLTHLRDLYHGTLCEDVLPFWLKHGIDRKHGGCFSCLDRDGSLLDTDKSVWVQGRFAWLLAHLHRELRDETAWLDAADSCLRFLDRHCVDPDDGLLWFHVTEDGAPIRKRRYRFSEAFACMANAAWVRASGEPARGRQARHFFDVFHAHLRDPFLSPFPPKFAGTRPVKSIGAPMIGINMAQVCRSSGIEGNWDEVIDNHVKEIRTDFVRDGIECVLETVGTDGTLIEDHYDGRTLNPGHAIEAAWFLLEEARHRNNDPHLVQLGCRMLDWMWERGWDREFGGILYFVGLDGRPVQEYWHDMKFWWPHNETIIATLMAWQLTGDDRYAAMHRQVHDWSFAHFPDPEHGEWYGYLGRDGSVSSPAKGTLWKGPFHLPRMLLKAGQICDEVLTNLPSDPTPDRSPG